LTEQFFEQIVQLSLKKINVFFFHNRTYRHPVAGSAYLSFNPRPCAGGDKLLQHGENNTIESSSITKMVFSVKEKITWRFMDISQKKSALG
jgi:hypothetical protein